MLPNLLSANRHFGRFSHRTSGRHIGTRLLASAALFLVAGLGLPAASAQEPPASAAKMAAEIADEEMVAAAAAFAQKLTDDASAALLQEGASEEEKLAAFQEVLTEGLAVEVIGRFMLGDARTTMTEAQTTRYNAAFPPYITRLYADQFSEIVGKSLKVIDSKEIGRRDVIVRTQFPREGSTPINVDWRVRKLKSGDRKAIDIIVSGVSIMLVKREEFASFIDQNGVDALLDRLEAEG